jgi:ABC-type multidrug transport system fused ATPase/permease subunit
MSASSTSPITAVTEGAVLDGAATSANRLAAPRRPLLAVLRRAPGGWAALCVAALGALAENGFTILAAAGVGWLAGTAATGGALADLTPGIVVVVLAVCATAVGNWALAQFGHVFAFRTQAELRLQIFDGLARSAPRSVANRRTGDLASVAMGDVDALEHFFAHLGIGAVVAAATSLGSAISLAVIHPLLGVIGLVGMVLVAVVPVWTARRGAERGSALRAELGAVNADVVDGVQGLRELLVFGHFDAWSRRILRGTRTLRRRRVAQARAVGAQAALTDALVAMTAVAATGAVILLLDRGELTFTYGAIAVTLLMAALVPVTNVVDMAGSLAPLRASAHRVLEIIDQPSSVPDIGTRSVEDVRSAEVRFEGVSFAYPGRGPVLTDVDLVIPAGGTVALVGASGAGKSTCANLLLRFFDPDAGRITVGGRDLREFAVADLHRLVTVVAQDVHLFTGSVAENLRLGRPDASSDELEEAARAAQAHTFISALPQGYDTPVGERGALLSGGQRQRLTIARALLADAPVLVLDEAASNLDTENERLVQRALEVASRGRTTLVIAHRLSTVRGADGIVVLDGGRVAEAGTHAELMAAGGRYEHLMRHQHGDRLADED